MPNGMLEPADLPIHHDMLVGDYQFLYQIRGFLVHFRVFHGCRDDARRPFLAVWRQN
jgi:hypothetical protein